MFRLLQQNSNPELVVPAPMTPALAPAPMTPALAPAPMTPAPAPAPMTPALAPAPMIPPRLAPAPIIPRRLAPAAMMPMSSWLLDIPLPSASESPPPLAHNFFDSEAEFDPSVLGFLSPERNLILPRAEAEAEGEARAATLAAVEQVLAEAVVTIDDLQTPARQISRGPVPTPSAPKVSSQCSRRRY